MAKPNNNNNEPEKYDLLVIGGGSGGIATARRAASYGKKVVLFEKSRYGGTCVNVGCVPKKLMWQCATISHILHNQSSFYGFSFNNLKFNLTELKQRRDDYIKFLNKIYENNLNNDNIKHIESHAKFINNKTVIANGKQYTANNILIAVGGYPYIPDKSFPGYEYINTSDDFFNKLDKLPKKACVVGAGYIAVELAQVMQMLGTDVYLFIRGNHPLRKFDELIEKGVHNALRKSGVKVVTNSVLTGVYKEKDGSYKIKKEEYIAKDNKKGKQTSEYTGFDYILYAIGRGPLAEELGLDKTNIKQDKRGFIISDEFEETNEKNIYALGDINDKIALTPVAIRAGRFLADRLFKPELQKIDIKNRPKMIYNNVPTVIFSHPPVGTIGISERDARELAKNNKIESPITVYETHFRNLQYGVIRSLNKDNNKKSIENDELAKKYKIKTHMKLICSGNNEKVIGLHMIGEGCDEMLQGFSVAIKMGATKSDFDSVCAIHPTASEELVTLKVPRKGDKSSFVYEFETWDNDDDNDEQKKDE